MAETFQKPSTVNDTALKMATRTEFVTMKDIAEKSVGKGAGLYNLVDEYSREVTLANDLPVTFASDKFEDNGYFREPWAYEKASATTNIGSGPTFYKTGAYKRKDIMGMRDSAIAYEKREFDAAGTMANLYRTDTIRERLKWIALDNEHDMVYGNPKNDPQQMLGLLPRYSHITDQDGVIQNGEFKGMLSPYITLDAGGTADGELFSVLLVVPSVTNGVHIIVPDDVLWSAGITLTEGNWQDVLVTETDGKQHVHTQKFDKIMVANGIALQNRHGCIRIANVDLSSKEGLDSFLYAIDQAYETLSPSMVGSARVYMPQYAGSRFRKAFRGLISPASYGDAVPRNIGGDFSIDGHNFRPLFHLTMSESKIS